MHRKTKHKNATSPVPRIASLSNAGNVNDNNTFILELASFECDNMSDVYNAVLSHGD